MAISHIQPNESGANCRTSLNEAIDQLNLETTAGKAMTNAASAAAQTALLSAMVGDSGMGGTKGLAPAPGAGDAAAGKFLNAAGAYSVPPGALPDQATHNGEFLTTNGTVASWAAVSAGSSLLPTVVYTDDHTLQLTDAAKNVEMNKASANELEVPLDATIAIPVGSQFVITMGGVGVTTIVPESGSVIINHSGSLILTQNASVGLLKTDTNEWLAACPSGGGSSLPLQANTVFVSDSAGDDGTGVVGDPAHPFLTVQGAVDAFNADFPAEDTLLVILGAGAYSTLVVPDPISYISFSGAGLFLTSVGGVSSDGPLFNVTDIGYQTLSVAALGRDTSIGDGSISAYNLYVAGNVAAVGIDGDPGTAGGTININGSCFVGGDVLAYGGDGNVTDAGAGDGGTVNIIGPTLVVGTVNAVAGVADGGGSGGADGMVNITSGNVGSIESPGSTNTYIAAIVAGVFHAS